MRYLTDDDLRKLTPRNEFLAWGFQHSNLRYGYVAKADRP